MNSQSGSNRTVAFADGALMPVLGQGTWQMGENTDNRREELAALQLGIDLGLRCIDTAEMYGDGASERLVGEAIAGWRDEVFLVTKVSGQNATRRAMPKSCEASLRRLRVDTIDLYLIHWRSEVLLDETVEAFEKLRAEGKIRLWGTSNFDLADLEELGPGACAVDQVLYQPEARGIEYDLLP